MFLIKNICFFHEKNYDLCYSKMKKKVSKNNVWFYLFFILLNGNYGAEDLQSWSSLNIETKLPYSFKIGLEQELRLNNQASSFQQTFSEILLSYIVKDGVKLFIPFRYAIYNEKVKQRISFGGSFQHNLKLIDLKYRTKIQRTHKNGDFSDEVFINKFSIQYKIIKKIKPFLSLELFHLNHKNHYKFDESRFSLGTSIDLSRKKSIKVFYILKKEKIIQINPDKIHVLGWSFNYKW